MYRTHRLFFGASMTLLAATAALAGAFTPGNLVVVQVGADGNPSALSNAATPVFLKEIQPDGTVVQSIELPSSGSGILFTNSGTATSEGALSYYNGYLALAGYNAVAGTTGVASTAVDVVNRCVATVDMSGTVQLRVLTDAYDGANARAAVTDGNFIWTAGQGGSGKQASAGVRVTSMSGGTSLQLSGAVTNTRTVAIFDGQLYLGTGSGSYNGVNAVGTGLPTTDGQTITLLPGFPDIPDGANNNPSPYGFAFADANTLYVADDRASGGTAGPYLGGVLKYVNVGGTWTLAYRLQAGLANRGARGVTLMKDASGNTVVFATTADNKVVSLVDSGSGFDSFTTVLAAGANTAFRGIQYIPMTTAAKKISGKVSFGDGYVGATTPSVPVTFNVYSTGGSLLQTKVVDVDPSTGDYSFDLDMGISDAVLDISAQGTTFLVKRASGVAIGASGATVDYALINGDCDGDNAITVFDYNLLSEAFDTSDGDAGYDANADLDKDGSVTVFDYNILSSNFDLTGD